MKDNELFELCKKVYELFPNWVGLNSTILKYSDGYGVVNTSDLGSSKIGKGEYIAPLYTSDYLLEKLPAVVDVKVSGGEVYGGVLTMYHNGDGTYHVAYTIPFDEQNRGGYLQNERTALKALLKLTIALSEAGEL